MSLFQCRSSNVALQEPPCTCPIQTCFPRPSNAPAHKQPTMPLDVCPKSALVSTHQYGQRQRALPMTPPNELFQSLQSIMQVIPPEKRKKVKMPVDHPTLPYSH